MRNFNFVFLILSICLIIVSLTGCNQEEQKDIVGPNEESAEMEIRNNESSQAQNVRLSVMEKPKISIINMNFFRHEQKGNTINFIDDVTLLVEFDAPINMESAKSKIRFSSEHIKPEQMEWISPEKLEITLNYEDIPHEFSLIIEKGLENEESRELKEDVIVNFRNKLEKIIAEVKWISGDNEYKSNEFYHLTDTPKLFEITFSNPVDKESIELCLTQELDNKADMSFNWINDTKLQLEMSNFESGKYYFMLDYINNEDSSAIYYEGPILFGFYIEPQNKIYTLDMNMLEMEELKINFPEDILWLNANLIKEDKIIMFEKTDYIEVYDVYTEPVIYDIESNQEIQLRISIENEYSYQDIFNEGEIFTYEGGIFSLNGERIYGDGYFLDAKIFKDKGKLILQQGSYNEKITLIIYDNGTKEVHKMELDILHGAYEQGILPSELVLVDDGKSIIIEGIQQGENPMDKNYNIYKIDIKTREIKMIMENAESPIYIDDSNIIVTDREGNVKIIDSEGHIIKELPIIYLGYDMNTKNISGGLIYCKNFKYKDKKIVCTNGKEISIYNIDSGEIKTFTTEENLHILGIGKSKAYFSTN